MKTCTKCGKTKPFSEFSCDSSKADGLRISCKDCLNAVARVYRQANKEEINAKRRKHYQTEKGYLTSRKSDWRRIGIVDVDTLDWEQLVESQGNACFVCGDTIDVYTAHRDHDHETGLTRAAVCGSKCNQAMDRLQY